MKDITVNKIREILTSVDETFSSQGLNTVFENDILYIQIPEVGPDRDEVMLELGFISPSEDGDAVYLSVSAYLSEELDPVALGPLVEAIAHVNFLLPVGKFVFINNALYFQTEEGFSEELTKEEMKLLLEQNLAFAVNTINMYTSSLLRVSKGLEDLDTFLEAL